MMKHFYFLSLVALISIWGCEETEDKPDCEKNGTGEVLVINETGTAISTWVIDLSSARTLSPTSNRVNYTGIPAGEVRIGMTTGGDADWIWVTKQLPTCGKIQHTWH